MSPTGSAAVRDRISAFVRVSAVLVGLANAAVFALAADRPLDDVFS